jgi:hypothetical protein
MGGSETSETFFEHNTVGVVWIAIAMIYCTGLKVVVVQVVGHGSRGAAACMLGWQTCLFNHALLAMHHLVWCMHWQQHMRSLLQG